jgi:hypothetical protein
MVGPPHSCQPGPYIIVIIIIIIIVIPSRAAGQTFCCVVEDRCG